MARDAAAWPGLGAEPGMLLSAIVQSEGSVIVSGFLEALEQVSEQDLEEIRTKAEEAEALAERLRGVQRVIEIKLGLRPAPGMHSRGTGGGRKKKAAAGEESESPAGAASADSAPPAVVAGSPPMTQTERHRAAVREFLMANGPQSQAVVCKRTGVPIGSITNVLKHPWFTHTARGIELTRRGQSGD